MEDLFGSPLTALDNAPNENEENQKGNEYDEGDNHGFKYLRRISSHLGRSVFGSSLGGCVSRRGGKKYVAHISTAMLYAADISR